MSLSLPKLFRRLCFAAFACVFLTASAVAKESSAALEKRFTTTVQPFLKITV
jgi:hypothetical protein